MGTLSARALIVTNARWHRVRCEPHDDLTETETGLDAEPHVWPLPTVGDEYDALV